MSLLPFLDGPTVLGSGKGTRDEMNHRFRFVVPSIAAVVLAGVFPATLRAQDTNAQIEALNKRVAELEAKLPKDSGAAATPGGDELMKWNEFQALGSRWK